MVFNLISFSIRFAPPHFALAFEQRHVRFVKIPITHHLAVIILYYIGKTLSVLLLLLLSLYLCVGMYIDRSSSFSCIIFY